MEFALHPSLDAEALARQFSEKGKVSIEPFLEVDQAEKLHHALRDRADWRQVIYGSGDKIFELDREAQAGLSEDQRESLNQAVYAQARNGFQYRYETLRVPDEAEERAASDDILCRFASFMSGGTARDFLRKVIDDQRVQFADAQATAYSPGDFLTSHDDDVAGKNRSAAYVLSLNPVWRIEWGGLFLMHGPDGQDAEALVPGFNRLNLFAVPQLHSVTEVTRAAANRRYSITGWLRR